jgi:hypothetical protein
MPKLCQEPDMLLEGLQVLPPEGNEAHCQRYQPTPNQKLARTTKPKPDQHGQSEPEQLEWKLERKDEPDPELLSELQQLKQQQ